MEFSDFTFSVSNKWEYGGCNLPTPKLGTFVSTINSLNGRCVPSNLSLSFHCKTTIRS